jgi:hypothetical protein
MTKTHFSSRWSQSNSQYRYSIPLKCELFSPWSLIPQKPENQSHPWGTPFGVGWGWPHRYPKMRLHKEGLYTIGGKKRVEKQIPPCLYYQTKTPSMIFRLKIITPSYTQRDELKKLGLHSDIQLWAPPWEFKPISRVDLKTWMGSSIKLLHNNCGIWTQDHLLVRQPPQGPQQFNRPPLLV